MGRVPVPDKYLRQIELAILEASFQAWQSLGNLSPLDDSGISGEISSCVSASCPFDLPSASVQLADSTSERAREISGYCDLLRGLTAPRPSVSPSAVEKLFPCCTQGNPRAQKILSAAGCILGGMPAEVPGLDRPSSILAAAEFFASSGDTRASSLLLSHESWKFPRSYRLAAMVLMTTHHPRAARVAWEMGAGMGDEISSSHCAAFDYLEGKGSPSRFRAIHQAAERGFPLPLLLSAAALELGVGVDRDRALASVYMSVAKRIASHSYMLDTMRAKMNDGRPFSCERRSAPTNASEIMFNWASKHSADPIHTLAAIEWRRVRMANRSQVAS